MEFYADLHCHTKNSDGKNTVVEMIEAAAQKGLTQLAITDHGPNNIGTGVDSALTYYKIGDEIREYMTSDNYQSSTNQLEVLLGAEADVISLNGDIDIPKKVCSDLDWLIIGLHPYIYPADWSTLAKLVVGNQLAKVSKSAEKAATVTNTKALVEALHRHKPHCVSHPNLQMQVDLAEIVRACNKNNVLFEINTGHHFQQIEDITQVVKEGVNLVVNSDAHSVDTLGELSWAGELLTKAKVPVEQVYNSVKEVKY